MGIIKAVNLIFDYIRHDEEEDKDEVSHALKGVSLDIKEGDFVAILGHNGSGKSTFAKLMNGILLPTDGTVYISKMRTGVKRRLSGHQGRRFRSDFRTQRIRKIHIREADERNPASNGWNSLYF